MNRPRGKDALKFLEKWDLAYRDIDAKNELLREYHITYRTARGWVDTIRHEASLDLNCPITQKIKHKNQFIKQSNQNPTFYKLNVRSGGTAVAFQDAHHPFQDKTVLNLNRKILVELQPDYIFIPGDWWDLYQISRFDKDPDRLNDFQRDIDIGINTLYWIKQDVPNSKIILLDGNHEDRIRKLLWRRIPELESLRSLNPDTLLGLVELEIDRVPKRNILLVNDIFQVEHGDVVSKHSSWTAKAMYERRGGCGICGHSHRGGSYYKVDSDYFGWWENFCTCNLNPEWVKKPNWMHGFSIISFIQNRFFVEQVQIIKNKFIYGGKLYE